MTWGRLAVRVPCGLRLRCEDGRSWCGGWREWLGEENGRQCCPGIAESDTRIGYALADSIGVIDPLVAGRVTQMWLFDLVRKHFLAEFVGLDPLSVLDYLRVRLASVVQESFLDRLPRLIRVSILDYICRVWFFKGHLILFFLFWKGGLRWGKADLCAFARIFLFYFVVIVYTSRRK